MARYADRGQKDMNEKLKEFNKSLANIIEDYHKETGQIISSLDVKWYLGDMSGKNKKLLTINIESSIDPAE